MLRLGNGMKEPREQIDRIEHSSFLTCKCTEAQISTKPKTIRWAHNKADDRPDNEDCENASF